MTQQHSISQWPAPIGTQVSFFEFLKISWRVLRGRWPLFQSSEMALISCPVNPRARRILPYGLFLDETRPAEFLLANHVAPLFSEPYLEAGVMLPVRGLWGQGYYVAWMVVDDDTALIYGRELLGVPKKMAQLTWERSGMELRVAGRRRKQQLFEAQVNLSAADQDLAGPVFDRPIYSTGGAGQFMLFAPTWCVRSRETVADPNSCQATVSLTASPWDDLRALINLPVGPLKGRLVRVTAAGGRYWLPAGIGAGRWYNNALALRCR